MLIEEVGKQWQGQIWDRIITTSDFASSALKERTKASIQQKRDALLQKYRDIKDKWKVLAKKPFRMTGNFLRI
jgi:hypothetical protein